MSTFSHTNGPMPLGYTNDDINNLKAEIAALKTTVSSLNSKLSGYPNTQTAKINDLTVDTLTILNNLISTAISIAALSITSTGEIRAGTKVTAPKGSFSESIETDAINANSATINNDLKVKSNLSVAFKVIAQSIEAIHANLKQLIVSDSLTVGQSAIFSDVIKLLKDVDILGNVSTKDITSDNITAKQKVKAANIEATTITVANAIIKESITLLGKLQANAIHTLSLKANSIETLRLKADEHITTSHINTNEPIPHNLISYTNGTTVEIYHIIEKGNTAIPHYLGGNENAHFHFFAFSKQELPTYKYFYTEHGRHTILDGMKALVLRIDERLNVGDVHDLPNIFIASVTNDTVTWKLHTNVVCPAKHSASGWKFHIEYIRSYIAQNKDVYDHEFTLCWTPYISKENLVNVGSVEYNLNLNSQTKPTVNENGTVHNIAYTDDCDELVQFKGLVSLFAYNKNDLPDIDTELRLNNKHSVTVSENTRALVIDKQENSKAAIYKLVNKKWELDNEIVHQNKKSYVWHALYYKSNKDKYYHGAEIVWAPYVLNTEKVSILETLVDDYDGISYDKEYIDKLQKDITERINTLFTIQPNWLEKEPVIVYNGEELDNPAYIRNKPVTGVSLLDGGNWDNEYPHPDFVVLGGNFSELETNINHILDPDNEYQNCIVRVMSGNKASLPAAREETKNTFKFCTDTGELYIDCFELQGNTEIQPLLINGNFLIRSKEELKSIASLLWKPSDINAVGLAETLISLRNTKFPIDEDINSTNEILCEGNRIDKGIKYPFKYSIKGSERVRFKKTTQEDKYDDTEYYAKEYNIEVDIIVDDIINYLKDNDKRIYDIEEKFKIATLNDVEDISVDYLKDIVSIADVNVEAVSAGKLITSTISFNIQALTLPPKIASVNSQYIPLIQVISNIGVGDIYLGQLVLTKTGDIEAHVSDQSWHDNIGKTCTVSFNYLVR